MKRFYKEVTVEPVDGGWQVRLGGRGIKTQRGSAQVVPTRALADLLAEEWAKQGDEIDPRSFVFRDLADYAIDMVARDREAAIKAPLEYAQTDTLCYRADPEDALFARQQHLWEPLVTACEAREGVRFARVSGIVHKPHADQTEAKLRKRLEKLDDFALAGVQMATSIAASLIIGLAALEPDADAETLFAAANAEEDWQAELWGWDEAAEHSRATRMEAFGVALQFLAAARS